MNFLTPAQAARDAAILREIKTLNGMNGKPAAEFWKAVDAAGVSWPGDAPPLVVAPFDAEVAVR